MKVEYSAVVANSIKLVSFLPPAAMSKFASCKLRSTPPLIF